MAIVEKTYYIICQAARDAVRDKNIENSLLASEDINDIKWYMKNVLHVRSKGIQNINLWAIEPATTADNDFFDNVKPGQYYIAKSVMKFGRGYFSKDLPGKIKEGWKKIREYYKNV